MMMIGVGFLLRMLGLAVAIILSYFIVVGMWWLITHATMFAMDAIGWNNRKLYHWISDKTPWKKKENKDIEGTQK
jgi:hypothetical protein